MNDSGEKMSMVAQNDPVELATRYSELGADERPVGADQVVEARHFGLELHAGVRAQGDLLELVQIGLVHANGLRVAPYRQDK